MVTTKAAHGRTLVAGPDPCSSRSTSTQIRCAKGAHEKELKASRAESARAVRSLPIKLLAVAKTSRGSPVEAVAADYAEKISRYCTFEQVLIRPNPKNANDVSVQLESEGEKVMQAIGVRDWVVLLDERGRTITSEQMAELLATAGDSGSSSLIFCIGGPFGHGNRVKGRANDQIRLSSMVLNHEVARIVLLEQVYRAWTILKGQAYHH
eukprot:jgi/Mesvir1/26950/Mv20670-RA.1